MAEVQLYYFPIRGKAEFIRLLFKAAGQPFEDNTVPRESWGPSSEAKKCKKFISFLISHLLKFVEGLFFHCSLTVYVFVFVSVFIYLNRCTNLDTDFH